MKLIVDCPPLPKPVYVDREMWEKIVLNLVSNAFKFTFEGEIEVSVAPAHRGTDRARHRHGHSGGRDPAPVRAFPPRQGRARTFLRGQRHRSRAGAGAGEAAWRHRAGRKRGRPRQPLHRLNPARQGASACRPHRGRAHARLDRAAAEAYVEEALRWLPERQPAADELRASSRRQFERQPPPAGASSAASCSPTTMPTCAIMCGGC